MTSRTIRLSSLLLLALPGALLAQSGGVAAGGGEVTYTRDVAPILQENCERCHRADGVAPMALSTYEQVRPWAPMIRVKTQIRDRMGAMPPYYVERGIGIQEYKDDERLTEAEIGTIAQWVDLGAPEGDPTDMPPPRAWPRNGEWRLGEPDLVVRTQDFQMRAGDPDWWGDMEPVPTGLTEDRHVRAVEIREINDISAEGGGVGGRFIVHHVIWRTRDADGELQRGWPVHELGRNPDIFNPRAGRLLKAGASVVSESVHLNAAAEDATGYLEYGFYLHPRDYEPDYVRSSSVGLGLGDGLNIDIQPDADGQRLHAFSVLPSHMKITSFEPHLHAPGYRMCLEAIWGNHIETLSCAGYDHNWVKQYTFADDYAPILPRGTVLHIVAEMDNTAANPNIPDPRNWQGSGNRSVSNMFIDLGNRVLLNDEQFVREMAERRKARGVDKNDHIVGCPLCMAELPLLEVEAMETATETGSDR